MTELEYAISHGGLTRKRLLRKISRRGFGASILGAMAGAAVSNLAGSSLGRATRSDFTIALIPDPQYLAGACPNNSGGYYSSMMSWIVNNKNMTLASGNESFNANIKAVVGVGDCVDSPTGTNQYANVQTAWSILDMNRVAFTTPPGNHDYAAGPANRSNLGSQFATGYFSATNRSAVYGSGIALGEGDMAYWVGSYDSTGANTAVKFVISETKLLILAMDFFAGAGAWSWAYDVMLANSDCECYITTHAWLTSNGMHFQRTDTYGPDAYSMAAAPYSNCSAEAWSSVGVNTWPNLFGIFGGHDLMGSQNSNGGSQSWYWQQVPIQSASLRKQPVQQLYINAQELDNTCSMPSNPPSAAGQTANVFLLSRRLGLGMLEGRMISTQSGNWFGPAPASGAGASWSTSETLLFSVPFTGLQSRIPNPVGSLQHR